MPLKNPMALEASLDGERVQVLKDDACNTNAVSREFLKNNSELFEFLGDFEVMHSGENTGENASQVILGAENCVGTHADTLNWVVASCKCEVLLRMPWHVADNPKIEF